MKTLVLSHASVRDRGCSCGGFHTVDTVCSCGCHSGRADERQAQPLVHNKRSPSPAPAPAAPPAAAHTHKNKQARIPTDHHQHIHTRPLQQSNPLQNRALTNHALTVPKNMLPPHSIRVDSVNGCPPVTVCSMFAAEKSAVLCSNVDATHGVLMMGASHDGMHQHTAAVLTWQQRCESPPGPGGVFCDASMLPSSINALAIEAGTVSNQWWHQQKLSPSWSLPGCRHVG